MVIEKYALPRAIPGASFLVVLALLLGAFTFDAVAQEEQVRKEIRVGHESPRFLTQGGVILTQADIDGYLAERVPAEDRAGVLSSPQRIGNLLNSLILADAFVPLAEDAGLLDDELVQARLYRAVVNQIRAIYRSHYLDEIELDSYETQARELYLTRREQFVNPDRIDFDHILVTVGSQRSEVEAMHRILELHQRLAEGEDPAELARQYSDDPSVADNDGRLTEVNPGELVGQLAAVLGEIEPGVYSDPVRTRFGWHIVRLTEVHRGGQQSWDEARERAEHMAREQHRTAALERLLRDVQDAPADFADGAVAALLARYGVSGLEGAREPELSGD